LDELLKDNPRVIFLIDEISMVSGELINKISNALCLVKRSSTAFGGLPTIFFGDLAQLLPFSDDGSPVSLPMSSTIFSSLSVQHVYHPCRQTDVHFFEVLSMIRQNKLDNSLVIDALSSRIVTTQHPHPDSTVLIAYKVGAEEFNAEKLALLPGDIGIFRSIGERGGYGIYRRRSVDEHGITKGTTCKRYAALKQN
jgi:ATP-dependent DNA helicase PIF1